MIVFPKNTMIHRYFCMVIIHPDLPYKANVDKYMYKIFSLFWGQTDRLVTIFVMILHMRFFKALL